MQLVRLNFKGSIDLEIDTDPGSDEDWVDAIGSAWAALRQQEIKDAATLDSHEILLINECPGD